MGSPTTYCTIQDLMEEILQIQKDKSTSSEVIQRVQEIINKSNELVENSESASEIIIDAKILHTGSQVVNSNITLFETNLTAFDENEFGRGVGTFLNDVADGIVPEEAWEGFATTSYHIYRKSVTPTFVLGSFDPELAPLPPRERAKSDRSKKVVDNLTKLCESSEDAEETEAVEENIYECILKSLMRYYKANDKKPVNFLKFIMNPDSYWHSVENVFYFSFLVRDGRVNMFINEQGLPVVEPVLKAGDSVDKSRKAINQFSFALSKSQWKDCIKKFKITSAKIKPFQKN